MTTARFAPAASRTTAIVLGAFASLTGCHRDAVSGESARAVPTAPAVPVDHLAAGELLEGSAEAFDLRLPRSMRVEGVFPDTVYASGPLQIHPVVQYLRARLEGGELREGEQSATFEHVKVIRKPGRDLQVRVASAPYGVRVEFRDETPPPAANLPNEAARWRHVGVTPEGRVADPAHFE